MKNKNGIIILYILIIIEIIILLNSNVVVKSILATCKLFFYNIFPTLFPTMVISNILVKQGVERIIPNFIKKMFKIFFNLDEYKTSIFITSIFTGTPTNALIINEALKSNRIKDEEADKLILSTHYINPLFIINVIGVNIFNSALIGALLYVILIIENLFKLYLNKNVFTKSNVTNNVSEDFITSFKLSVKLALDALVMILGLIIIFNLLLSLINDIFVLPNILSVLLSGLLEVTTGIIGLSSTNLSNILKFILSYIFINFGGLCIHVQVISIFKNKKISYLKYLIYRIF